MLYPGKVRSRYRQLTLIFLCVLAGTWWFTRDSRDDPGSFGPHERLKKPETHHPLDDVINEARDVHQARLSEKTTGLYGAVYAYRRRRGRHPPPGFEKWYIRASRSDAIVVESFFDQIYEDLEPFWGMEPVDIRNSLTDWQWTLQVRNGKVGDIPQARFRSRVWGKMIQEVAADLPDMDIAINPLDEPRVFVPWSEINALTGAASLQRDRTMSLPPSQVLNRQPELSSSAPVDITSHQWITKGTLWPHVLNTCPPRSSDNNSTNPKITTHTSNWTMSKDICANHHWAEQHGSLIKPATMDISTDLLPLFSAAKLQGSNDILLPPPSYYTDDVLFTGKGWFGDGKTSTPWHKKIHGLVWRGKATGGLVDESTWRVSQRQRLVSMLNASDASSNLDEDSLDWPVLGAAERDHRPLHSWLSKVADAGFTDTMCSGKSTTKACQGMSNRFQPVSQIAMKKQYHWKYLPDIDGNSLSGRFRAFLTSNSSPMKATIFKEWHDSRLMPWVHFIPLDITLQDLWSTMAYFLGFASVEAHDFEGERIATEGRLWANNVLRKEDMLLYVHRVLLEYGRLCDDDRDRLGFTDDWRAG